LLRADIFDKGGYEVMSRLLIRVHMTSRMYKECLHSARYCLIYQLSCV
jgi:hypothetical protein